ncbi:unnamed protein product [Adineta ricciae]|uniref:Uncharacterized protein n=1 Tax=Adineta ricciae TaxID=249248 RepID=A0A813VNK2_ADIRI|nr:unnamed protein product [Adineta ricciae]CAF1261083.1 unnamed protein product [Adineta ricciae]
MEVIALVHRNNQTAKILLTTTDSLDYIYKAVSAEFQIHTTDYTIQYSINNEHFNDLTNDSLCQMMLKSKTIELFVRENDHNHALTITITITPCVPVEQRIVTLTQADLNEKFKKRLGLQQYFDIQVMSTKFFLSEIFSHGGEDCLEQCLVKKDMPAAVKDFIRNNLYTLADCRRSGDKYDKDRTCSQTTDDIIFKMTSIIDENLFVVIIVYALVNNEQKNFATSLVKKMIPNQKFNKGVEGLLDEIIEEVVNTV